MVTLQKLKFLRMILVTGLAILSQAAFAGSGGVVATSTLDGSQHQIMTDSMRTVIDSAFFNPAYTSDLDTSYSVQNIVTLMINESSPLYLRTPFTITVRLRILYSNSANGVDSTDRDFTINYDTTSAYSGRSSFVFNGAHRVTVKVLTVTSNVTTWDPTTVLLVENKLIARPHFIFSCGTTISGITVSQPATSNADELPVSWTAVTGADQYDLEWTFIDSSALANQRYGNPLNPTLVFRNNASRVSITGTSYNIPLIYGNSATVFIRVRPVQLGQGYATTAAVWSSDASPSVMGQYSFSGHERPLNWVARMSFAEEGKRRIFVQYFDGSLRDRQTVTKDNTTNTTVIGETYYNYQGVAAIEVMPAPSLGNIIQYTPGFNVAIGGSEYGQSNFDSLPAPGSYCDMHADSMSNISGASQYYSPNNPNKTAGLNQFIPDAHDYPFKEILYTPDNTGRYSLEGDAGPDYVLGSGHETKYFYGTPDQNELDALFGTEVGDHTHYFKTMIRDANGQYSVKYDNMYGMTIATALAGAAPAKMAALPSNSSATITENLADSNSVIFQDLSMISQKGILVPVAGNYQFNYSLTPAIYTEQNCNQQNICYTCLYDLEVTVSDNCNNQLLPGQKAYDTVLHNFSLANISPSCSSAPMNLQFTLNLPEGSYVVTKKLTANKDAYNYYRDSVYIPANTCTSLQQFITQQQAINAAANPQCAPSCSACKAGVGTWSTFWANYIAQSGLSIADTATFKQDALTAYQNALASCAALCGDSLNDADDIRNAMLQDMTPPYGQYADTTKQTDPYSIFYISPKDTIFYIPVYKQKAVVYLDESNNPDSVYNQQSGLTVDPNSLYMDQFVQSFQSSWAEALLPYHPEYCKLLTLESLKPSQVWDRQMESIDDYQDAYNQGYLNPTGNGAAPFSRYPSVPANIDPLSTYQSGIYKQQLETILKAYQPVKGNSFVTSLWALACTMVKCNANDQNCLLYYKDTTNDFNTAIMCQGDLDMAWRTFRELYLEAKSDIVNKLVNTITNCTPMDTAYTTVPTAYSLFTVGHHSEFNDKNPSDGKSGVLNESYLGALNQDAGSSSGAANAKALAQDSLNSFYAQNVNSIALQWTQQLAPCQYTNDQLNNNVLPALKGLCLLACDSAHPFGASSLPAGLTYPAAGSPVFTNFQQIIGYYNQLYSITDTLECNAEMITAPAPYGSQPIYGNEPVYARPSTCECNLIRGFFNLYRLAGKNDASFSAYLQRTQQITMSDADLNQLLAMCGNPQSGPASCTWLSQPIFLPPAMQCNSGTTCASCTLISSMYQSYLAAYPADTPAIGTPDDTVQAQMNTLFQNYMNNRLGYSKQAAEYLDFMNTCAAQASSISNTLECLPYQIGNIFNSGGTDKMMDIQLTDDGGYILAGSTTGAGAGGQDAYIVKANDTGTVEWARTIGGTGDDRFTRVRQTGDFGFIAIGTTKSAQYAQGEILITRMNAAGTTLWTRAIGFGTPFGETGYDIIQTNDGGYAALGIYDEHHGNGDLLLTRLDSTGNIDWVHRLGTSMSENSSCSLGTDTLSYSGTPTYGLMEHLDTLMVTGTAYDPNIGNRYFGVVYQVSKDSGNLAGAWYYQDSSENTMSSWFGDIYPTANGYLIAVTNALKYGSDSSQAAVVNLSPNGTVLSYNRFNLPAGNDRITSSGLFPTLDGGYLVAQTGDNTPHIFWQKMSSTGALVWSRESVIAGTQSIGRMVQNEDSSFAAVANENSQALLLNLPSSPSSLCYDSTVSLGQVSPSLVKIHWAVQGDEFLTPANTNITLTGTAFQPSDSSLTCSQGTCYNIYSGPTLCGKSSPIFPDVALDSTTACTDSTFFSVSKGTELFNAYVDSLTGDFEQRYNNTCLQAYKYESFTVTHAESEYHYTLYYYDQAGNLVKTIPPAGVQQNTDPAWLSQVRAARAAGQVLVPAHTLETDSRYNTLNQTVARSIPDGGQTSYWYDWLGRMTVFQDARQIRSNQYSYILYDSIGRIMQKGQVVSPVALTDSMSSNQSILQQWLANAFPYANQINVTSFDYPYAPLQPMMSARNTRNRVAWSAKYNTAADLANSTPSSAMYYSYDIDGSIDTLVQDFTQGTMAASGNRFKKLIYQYDLISEKVNWLAYQPGQQDAFYHNYIYDAENRLTNVQSSPDSINWDNDAFYSYYAHGPMARMVLGDQQVQGLNYAYTLHGWLKAINPPVTGSPGYNLVMDGSNGSVVGTSAYNLLLNYYNNDYSPISGAAPPDASVSTTLSGDYRPLYNGNISSIGVNINTLTHPLLYNYQYDQLNRLVGMDAWNRTDTAWSQISKLADFQERIAYDPNGNILKYLRNGNNTFSGDPLGMDSLTYSYTPGTNRLDHINDSVPSSNYTTDLDNQSPGNYAYDSVGELVSDNASGISNITWNIYGKIDTIMKSDGSVISFTYDANENRISKTVLSGGDTITTWYVRDVDGNVMSTYVSGDPLVNSRRLTRTESDMYGANRLGLLRSTTDMQDLATPDIDSLPLLGSGIGVIFTRGNKLFELNNHLENVLVTVSDKKFGHSADDSTVDYYTPEIVDAQDYYPFGSLEPGRTWSKNNTPAYRYGFNGKENDDEVKGQGNQQDYGMRTYDPRVGRFLSVDPLEESYPWYSPYQFAGNNPVLFIDLDGLEPKTPGKNVGDSAYGQNGKNGIAAKWIWDGKQWTMKEMEGVVVKAVKKRTQDKTGLSKTKDPLESPWMNFILNDASRLHGAKESENPTKPLAGGALKELGLDPDPVSTAWCAAYASHIMKIVRFKNPHSASSKTWFESKTIIKQPKAYYGAIAVFQDYSDKDLKHPNGSGHISFLYAVQSDGTYVFIGGNQHDMLRFNAYAKTFKVTPKKGDPYYMHFEGFYFPSDYTGPKTEVDKLDKIKSVDGVNKAIGVDPSKKGGDSNKTQ